MIRIYRPRKSFRISLLIVLLACSIMIINNDVINTNTEIQSRILHSIYAMIIIWTSLLIFTGQFIITPTSFKIESMVVPKSVLRNKDLKWEEIKAIDYNWLYGIQVVRFLPNTKGKIIQYLFLRIFLENPREIVRTVIENCPHARVDEELIEILKKEDTFGKWMYITFNGLFLGSITAFLILIIISSIINDQAKDVNILLGTFFSAYLFLFILLYYLEGKNEDYYK